MTNEKIKLCILFGGKSSEHDVSLISAYGVLSNVDRNEFDVISVGITKNGEWYLYEGELDKIKNGTWCESAETMKKTVIDPAPGRDSFITVSPDGKIERLKVDVVFPVLHGANGEDGTLQGLLSLAGVKYVGCDHTSSGVCMDKAFTKVIIGETKIPQAKSVTVNESDFSKNTDGVLKTVGETLGYPVFVKPSRAGSSVGASKAGNAEELKAALEKALVEDSKIIVEEFIIGKECEVAVFENEGEIVTSVVGEIDPGCEFYDYETKYENDNASYYIPARLNDEQTEFIKNCAETIFKKLDCRTLSRVDFFVCNDGKIIFNEINTIPGFTPISMYPKLFIHSGKTYGEIITMLVKSALCKKR